MAFEIKNFEVAKKLVLDKSEFEVECNILLGDNVSKILVTSIEASVGGSETLNGVANYSGTIDTKIVFLNDNGELNTVCSTCPFSSKFLNEDIVTGQKAYVNVKVVDYSIESINGDSARISVMLMQSGFILSNKEVHTIENIDENVCCKYDEIDVVKFLGSGQETFEISAETTVRDKIKKLVLTQSSVLVKNVEPGVNFITVSGDINTRVLYLNENDKFEDGYMYDTFKEEIEIEGVNRDSYVEGLAFVKQEDVVAEILSDEKGDKIVVKSPVTVEAFAYVQEKLQVIKDFYSIKQDIHTTTQSFEMSKSEPLEVVEEKIEGSLSLSEEQPRVDKVLFYGGNTVTVTNNYINDGAIYIEGIARTNVVYLNDEDNSWHSVQLDTPFLISEKTDVKQGSMIAVDAVVTDVDVSVKKGRELLYESKVKAGVNYTSTEVSAVIAEAIEKEEYEPKDFAMEVVFAKQGQEIWDVAKAVKVKEEQIVLQNPNVVFPLEQDSPLILFYQKLN